MALAVLPSLGVTVPRAVILAFGVHATLLALLALLPGRQSRSRATRAISPSRTFFRKKQDRLDKAKPAVRRGRKTMDLQTPGRPPGCRKDD